MSDRVVLVTIILRHLHNDPKNVVMTEEQHRLLERDRGRRPDRRSFLGALTGEEVRIPVEAVVDMWRGPRLG